MYRETTGKIVERTILPVVSLHGEQLNFFFENPYVFSECLKVLDAQGKTRYNLLR
jgi:hypothetical protein